MEKRARGRMAAWAMASMTAGTAAAWLAGCNLFSPLASDGSGELSYRGLILKGSQAINDGDYAAAEHWFALAKQADYRGSEAYLFHSKALAGLYKIDYGTLNDEFNAHRGVDGQEKKKGIPFVDSNTTVEGIDSIYYPVAQSVENLEHILRKSRDSLFIPGGKTLPPDGDTAGDGRVTDGVARLDLGLLQTLKGMLGPLDLDGDNHISRECGRGLCPGADDSAALAACPAAAEYRAECKEGPLSEYNRFERFKQLTRNIDIDNIDSKDVRAKQVSSDPNEINQFLDMMIEPIAASRYNLDSVTQAMDDHDQAKLSGQLNDIVSDVGDLAGFLGYMRYNDQLDNDFDAQDPRRPVRMVWHDYNKDGGIMYDYDDPDVLPYLTTARNAQCVNIGHPLHRRLHPELYVRFDDPEWTSLPIASDTSKNSRKAIMIKHCSDVAANLDVDGNKVTEALKLELQTVVCSTYTSLLKPDVKPPARNGVVRSDWQDGPFGTDEEEFDDRDNDYDGLKDEDTRNAKGMDDDDDGILDTSMIGTAPAPMVWHDVAGHGNACPDIDTTQPMPDPPFQRKFCIGSLEHRIYLAQHYGRDSLKAYYSQFQVNPESGGNSNCQDDFKKLPDAYKQAAMRESKDSTAFMDDVGLACQFKHIWKSGIPPPNSEWTSGVFGVDEEIPDGVDNDGDGWIDEDVK